MIIFIGPIPPPEGGFSLVTSAVYSQLTRSEKQVFLINRSHRYNISGLFSYFFSILRLLYTCISYREIKVYLALSGGFGIVIDLFFILLSRPFTNSIFIHHHSFAYLYRKSFLLSIVYSIFPKAVDIALCQCMANKLLAMYRTSQFPTVNRSSVSSYVISNSAWFSSKKPYTSSSAKNLDSIRLGFLSRPILPKGIREALELHSRLISNDFVSTLVLAGSSYAEFSPIIDSYGCSPASIISLGVLKHQDIDKFFDSIDFLLLPTNYINEVEPLVILESLSRGIPVLTVDRACISALIPESIPLPHSHRDFVDEFYTFLCQNFFGEFNRYQDLSATCINFYKKLNSNSLTSKHLFLANLCS